MGGARACRSGGPARRTDRGGAARPAGTGRRDDVTVLVDQELSFDPVGGVRYFRTRRSLSAMRHPTQSPRAAPDRTGRPPVRRSRTLDPHGTRSDHRHGAAAADDARATSWSGRASCARCDGPRRSATCSADVSGGSESLAEIDVLRLCRAWGLAPPRRQKKRRRTDRDGSRFTDCEWDLPDGRVLVLEIDGGFHIDVENYTEDVQRQRGLTTVGASSSGARPTRSVTNRWVSCVTSSPSGVPRAALNPRGWVLKWSPGQPFQHPTPESTPSWVLRWSPGQPFEHPTRGAGQRRRSARTGKASR